MTTKLTLADRLDKKQYRLKTVKFLQSNPDALGEQFFTISIVEEGDGAVVNVTPARHVEPSRKGDPEQTIDLAPPVPRLRLAGRLARWR
jgi:hypothetical protein